MAGWKSQRDQQGEALERDEFARLLKQRKDLRHQQCRNTVDDVEVWLRGHEEKSFMQEQRAKGKEETVYKARHFLGGRTPSHLLVPIGFPFDPEALKHVLVRGAAVLRGLCQAVDTRRAGALSLRLFQAVLVENSLGAGTDSELAELAVSFGDNTVRPGSMFSPEISAVIDITAVNYMRLTQVPPPFSIDPDRHALLAQNRATAAQLALLLKLGGIPATQPESPHGAVKPPLPGHTWQERSIRPRHPECQDAQAPAQLITPIQLQRY